MLGQYSVPNAGHPRTGFNAAAVTSDHLFASHSQLGAWTRPLAKPEEASALLRPIGGVPKTIRAAMTDSQGRLLLAADNRVHAYAVTGENIWIDGAGGWRNSRNHGPRRIPVRRHC